jgi:hypothetical protein
MHNIFGQLADFYVCRIRRRQQSSQSSPFAQATLTSGLFSELAAGRLSYALRRLVR